MTAIQEELHNRDEKAFVNAKCSFFDKGIIWELLTYVAKPLRHITETQCFLINDRMMTE